ncbi:MAG: tetratricopeptide repeat protein [Propionibacteriales bacterium]|nr:tetratricopeptide repeat protein [Propionibacteriales bacterium]
MTVPFSRPGAVDLSGLKKSASAGQAPSGPQRPHAAGGAPPGGGSGAYSVDLNQDNFQTEMQRSMQVPVVLSFWSRQSPPSQQLNAMLEKLADEFEGRFLFAKVDIDANPQIAQAVGVPGAPLVGVVLGGQLAPLAQNAVPEDELRQVLNQVVQTAVANGMNGRVEPREGAGTSQADTGEAESMAEEEGDPKYAEAEAALAAGEIDAAIAAYERVLEENPGDDQATIGLARTRLVARTQEIDVAAAREAAAANPADVETQIQVADADLLGGHVEDAFDRLVQTVTRVGGDERDRVRRHLVELFEIVGNDDPRVPVFRTRLANALF